MNHDNDTPISLEQTMFTLAVQIDRLREHLADLDIRVEKLETDVAYHDIIFDVLNPQT